jgi:iron(III) transport system substrate-binding protein
MQRLMAIAALATGLVLAAAGPTRAQGALNLYCSVQVEWCQAVANEFQRETGIRVAMTQRGSGETLAQIRAEAQNPRGDVWFGGTGDPHLIAAEENLTVAYESPLNGQLQDWALRQWTSARQRSIGIYSGALGFGFNREIAARKSLPEPRCWSDLLRPEFRDEVQMANPNSSGTAYVMIATIVQLMGEDQAFAYMRDLHRNINSYPRQGTAPIKAVARGETAVSISFVHDAVTEANAGFPVAYATPCEGTGYEIGSMSIIAGARNLAQARRFYDWALSPAAQRIGYEIGKQLQMPSNKAAPLPPNAPDLSKMKLVNYDFVKYGQSAERRRLLARWDRDVGALAK